MIHDGPFNPAEVQDLHRNHVAYKLWTDAPADKTVGELRAEVRAILYPPSLASQLEDLRIRRLGILNSSDADLLLRAQIHLEWMPNLSTLRPVEELRQEPYTRYGRGVNNGPNRWVILWGSSGYQNAPKVCVVGRRQPDGEKFAGKFVGVSCECVSDVGFEPTHFTELPDDVL